MGRVFFTADQHYRHANIIKYCKRPFSDAEEMNKVLIENHNSIVGPKDEVYMLGDIVFANEAKDVENIMSQLNGRKYLICGNHDKSVVKSYSGFVWSKDIAKIKVHGQKIILCHYAMRIWDASHYGSWQLFGHSHGNLEELDDALSCDVGVDVWDFKPVSFDQLKEKMDSKNFIPINKRSS